MPAKRIIPCLDVKGGRTVKGINFEGLADVGDPVELGAKYASEGADELVYLDISASKEDRATFTGLVSRIAERINIPFTVGGAYQASKTLPGCLTQGQTKSQSTARPLQIPDLSLK